MSPRKLSEGDRTQILKLYRETDETSSTLADRYGVSSSTISRILKLSLSQTEYESLIQEKRLARSNSKAKKAKSVESPILKQEDSSQNQESDKSTPVKAKNNDPEPEEEVISAQEETSEQITPPPETTSKPILKQKNNSSPAKEEVSSDTEEQNTLENNLEEDSEPEDFEVSEDLESVKTLKAMFGEEVADEEEDDEDDFDDEEYDGDIGLESTPSMEDIKVLPLSSAKFRRNCYLAIDRTSELMTRPLKDFAELGKIPEEEVNQRTLPVFDNHRVAKRFCDRKGKVIKVPDTQVIEKTLSCLQSKGITRLLMNGKVFDLS